MNGLVLNILMVVAILIVVVVVVMGFIWMNRRLREHSHAAETDALIFEREVLGNFSPGVSRSSASAMPMMMPTAPAPPNASPQAPPQYPPQILNQAPSTEPLTASKFAQSLADRLKAGNLLAEIEGPMRNTNTDVKGTVLRLRNGKRVVILDEPLSPESEFLTTILRHYDGVMMQGANGQALFIDRFENFLSGMIKF